MASNAVAMSHEPLGMVPGAVPHGRGLAHMQAQALGLSHPITAAMHGDRGMHGVSLAMHALPIGSSAGMSGIRLPMMGSLEQSMEAVMIGANSSGARLGAGMPGRKADDQEHGR